MANKSVNLETWLAFIFGLVAIGTLLAISISSDNHNALLVTISRIILAIACAGIAAVIPGLLHLNISPSISANVRAGGALAVFVLVYFFNPPDLIDGETKQPGKTPSGDYMLVVKEWMSLIDNKKYLDAYEIASSHTKDAYEAPFFQQLYESHAATVGSITSRRLIGANSSSSLPTGEKGIFRFISYEVSYSDGKKELEQYIVTADGDMWKIRDHTYFPVTKSYTSSAIQNGGG